jgi:transposase-like protein
MALHPIHGTCPYCQHPFNETPSRSFLGFQKISCPTCNENLTYPLSSGFRTTYRVLVIVMILILLVNLLQGRIGFPGIIGIAMCYALFRDWKLRKELNFD